MIIPIRLVRLYKTLTPSPLSCIYMKTYKIIRLSTHEQGRAILATLPEKDIDTAITQLGLIYPRKNVSLSDMVEYGEFDYVENFPAFVKAFSKANPHYTIVAD